MPKKGLLTLKVFLQSTTDSHIREYLPIFPSSIIDFPGLTWVSLLTDRDSSVHEIYALAVTDPSSLQNIEIPFRWDNTTHPEQLFIPKDFDNYRSPRRRTWVPERGRSKQDSFEPMQDPFDLPEPDSPSNHKEPMPFCTHSTSVEILLSTKNLLPVLQRFDNVYIRHQDSQSKRYFAKSTSPTAQGIVIEYGRQRLFFSRIRPLTDPKLILLSRQLDKYDKNDWISLFGEELHVLSPKIPDHIHLRIKRRPLNQTN